MTNIGRGTSDPCNISILTCSIINIEQVQLSCQTDIRGNVYHIAGVTSNSHTFVIDFISVKSTIVYLYMSENRSLYLAILTRNYVRIAIRMYTTRQNVNAISISLIYGICFIGNDHGR